MTLREEVLKNSGLLSEEILEEGKLGKAIAIGAMISALVFGGIKGAQELKNYKNKSAISVSEKFHRTDSVVSKTDFISFEKNNIKVYTHYDKALKQSYIYFSININDAIIRSYEKKEDLIKVVNDYKEDVSSACVNYIKNLEDRNSNIERILKTKTYAEAKPVSINVDFVWDKSFEKNNGGYPKFLANTMKPRIVKIIAETFKIDDKIIKVTFNDVEQSK